MRVEVPTPLPVDEQRRRADALLVELGAAERAKGEWRDGALLVTFPEGSRAEGVTGSLRPGAGVVVVELDLPWRLRVFSPMVESRVREKVVAAMIDKSEVLSPFAAVFDAGRAAREAAERAAQEAKGDVPAAVLAHLVDEERRRENPPPSPKAPGAPKAKAPTRLPDEPAREVGGVGGSWWWWGAAAAGFGLAAVIGLGGGK